MIVIMFILGLITTAGIVLTKKVDFFSSWHTLGMAMSALAGMLLMISLISIPIGYYSSKAEVNRYYALKESIDKARSNDSLELERAALIQEIVEYNKDLASVKYWNETIFDIYYYDGLAELDFLE